MNAASLSRLLILAALWGASFLFMRIAAPVLGASWLGAFRVGSAALFLLIVALVLRQTLGARQHWRYFAILGGINSALPFLLYGYAAETLSASLLAIINATAPIWGALVGLALGDGKLTGKNALGMLLGVSGVALLMGFDPAMLVPGAGVAAIAATAAALSYGIAANYARRASGATPFANAHGSMWAATFWLLPLLAFDPIRSTPDLSTAAVVLALGILCSGVAYLLYFRLIADLGAASALSVTFLIPLFGVLWGHLFLQEVVGWHTLLGGCTVLIGTALVTGFSPAALGRKPTRSHG